MFDFRSGGGRLYIGGIGIPVFDGDRLVFVAGVDITYEHTFRFLKDWETAKGQRLLLLAESGLILYSSDPSFPHRNITGLGFGSESDRRFQAALSA